jgi:drug/metabolite transporter (DMT)-like permease
MNIQTVRSNALLLITAIIWGFAFVAQRVGMEYLGPFTFNAARFTLGSLSLLPLLLISRDERPASENILPRPSLRLVVLGEFSAGFMLFMSMEAVFAAIGGWLLLDEILSMRGLMGCGLMLGGMLISQLWPKNR